MQEVDALLRELGMHPDCVVLEDCAAQFRAAMEAGLRGDRTGMQMLPTYISAEGQVPRKEKLIVIDAGGTNFRRAVAWFDDQGKLVLEQFATYPMPGTSGEVSLEEFFDRIADYLMPILGESDRIGFCFSYATEALPNMDGRLQHFCKEVQVRDAENIEVCAELKKALRRKGIQDEKRCVLMNDSVAALLGGKAAAGTRDYESWIGYIYGTGLNACYVEQTVNIPEARDYSQDAMIINMEAGMHVGFPMGEADRLLDEGSELPGDHMFEKLVSGAYLGRVMALTALLLVERGLFSHAAAHALRRIESFSLADINDFMVGGKPPIDRMDETDCAILRTVCDRLYARAAKLVAASIGAVLQKTGTGRNPARPVCCTMEGTTFRKSVCFREHFFRLERDYLNGTLGVYPVFLECADTTLAGTAIAALLN